MIRPLLLATSMIALTGPTPAHAAQRASGASPGAQVIAANRAALREPASTDYRNAVQLYPYAPGALYRLYAAPERVTDIALQPGETLVAVAAGDTVRWTVGDTTSGSGEGRRTHILVKPFAPGLATNLVITTDRRAYHLQLQSTANAAMTAIAWTYPDDELIALSRQREAAERAAPAEAGVALEQLNFAYEISGDRPAWRPVRVFDDGRQTFVEFPAGIETGEAPPFFVIGEDGEAALVNYRMRGRYYIVDRLFAVAELRLGTRRQQIVRIERAPVRSRSRRERAS